MLAQQRQELILRELELRGALTSSEFASRLRISAMTVRRDLHELERLGKLRRVQGGAISLAALAERERSPEGRRSRPLATIGMVVPSAAYYFPEMIKGAREKAQELGCRLVLCVSNYSASEELRLIRRLIVAGVDGMLVTTAEPIACGSPVHTLLTEAPVPVVLVERDVGEESSSGRLESVRSDHVYGAELAVNHLMSLSHSRIALAIRATPTAPWVRQGYECAARSFGFADQMLIRDIVHPNIDPVASRMSLETFLTDCQTEDMDAALVLTDEDAIALVDLALERGLQVPRDFAIVAYDDEIAALAGIPLTAVAPPKWDVGSLAFSVCLQRLSTQPGLEPPALGRTALMPRLHIRESTVEP